MLNELQIEINQLIHCYYNAIGVLQRDYLSENIGDTVKNIAMEIKKTKENIFNLIENKKENVEISDYKLKSIIKESEDFVKDGNEFIDKIIQELL